MNEEILSQQKLEAYLWGCAEYLRNKIDAGDYKVYIFPMLFYKRISDVYDEEYQILLKETNDEKYAKNPINHKFIIPEGSHWNDLRKITKDVGLKIQKSMQEIEKANGEILYGIFGDANWGYKERLSDETLINLIEHYSTQNLSLARIPDDQMGNAYEYLIKKFADDSGHTAAEFYTNRSLVSLMTELLKPQPNESIYDPTCGTGGMLLECINYLKRNKMDYRTLSLFGQEKNVISSAIARMNTLLHGYSDAEIKQDDTLEKPRFLKNDRLQEFDVILANPPYSIKKWNQKGWSNDQYNRNNYGTPPKGRADYAFIQHILKSLSNNGRTAILLPHGVLFRDDEEEIRKKLILDDKLDTIIGLPKDMFYNSPMESCIMIFYNSKTKKRKKHVLFIDATKEFERKDNKNFVNESHIKKISNVFNKFEEVKDFASIVHINEIISKQNLLSVSLYVKYKVKDDKITPKIAIKKWGQSNKKLSDNLKILKKEIEMYDENK
jgi:type I restriction enzyme M protein